MSISLTEFDPATEAYVSLATFRRDGREVRTPVWIVEHEGAWFVFSEGKAGKVKRIRNNGRARLAPCDVKGKLKSASWLEVTGSILKEPGESAQVMRAFEGKYGWQVRLLNFFSRLSGKINKRAVLKLEVPINPAVS